MALPQKCPPGKSVRNTPDAQQLGQKSAVLLRQTTARISGASSFCANFRIAVQPAWHEGGPSPFGTSLFEMLFRARPAGVSRCSFCRLPSLLVSSSASAGTCSSISVCSSSSLIHSAQSEKVIGSRSTGYHDVSLLLLWLSAALEKLLPWCVQGRRAGGKGSP